MLKGMRLSGNTIFTTDQLLAQIPDVVGKEADFAKLQESANRLSNFYRERGYTFARVYLPRQDVKDGVVELLVLEGRYGEVVATVDDHESKRPDTNVQAYVVPLKTGEVIHSEQVERIALIMNDIPGYTAVPIVRPGAQTGSGDLEMRMVEEADQLQGSFGLDNHGSRYTGENRGRASLERSRNFVFGDVIRLTALTTDKQTGMGHAAYAFPLLPNGLRMELSALYSTYEISGGGLGGLGFEGDATIYGAMVSYPIVRSQAFNVAVNGGLQHKRYVNKGGFGEKYAINAIPLTMTFDKRDGFNGGGVTYGALSALASRVDSDNNAGADRDRSFNKINLDIARLQRVTDRAQAMVKLAGQHTDDHIDATEFMSISGPYAVRAYPVGEFSGHKAWVGQAELSYQFPQWHLTPYVFYDHGYAVNTTTTLSRKLSGYGVGARYAHAGWSADLVAAWADKGKPSEVEPDDSGARIWLSISKRF